MSAFLYVIFLNISRVNNILFGWIFVYVIVCAFGRILFDKVRKCTYNFSKMLNSDFAEHVKFTNIYSYFLLTEHSLYAERMILFEFGNFIPNKSQTELADTAKTDCQVSSIRTLLFCILSDSKTDLLSKNHINSEKIFHKGGRKK